MTSERLVKYGPFGSDGAELMSLQQMPGGQEEHCSACSWCSGTTTGEASIDQKEKLSNTFTTVKENGARRFFFICITYIVLPGCSEIVSI